MPISQNDKESIIDKMLETKRKSQKLVVTLKFQRKTLEAEKVHKKARTLASQIDRLLAKSMDAWSGSAATILDDLRKSNDRLGRAISDIKKKRDVANKVIKAVGEIDEVIAKGKEILSKIP